MAVDTHSVKTLTGTSGTATFNLTPKGTYCLTIVGTIGGGTLTPTFKDSTLSPGTGMPVESVPGESVAFTTEGHLFFYAPDVDQLVCTLAGASGAALTIKLGSGLTTR